MLSVWWNTKGIVHWELLPPNSTVNAEVYCAQLDRVAAALGERQRKVYFLHDNARPHIAKDTQKKLQSLGWHVLAHPPYSPDLAPTDYHLFLSLSNHLKNKNFDYVNQLETYIDEFSSSKPQEFYASGIQKLPDKWQYVVDNDDLKLVAGSIQLKVEFIRERSAASTVHSAEAVTTQHDESY
nr:Transposase domain containing protein [Haemonchus contortus]